jgi:hypothetical protein
MKRKRASKDLLVELSGGDRRSIGKSNQVAAVVLSRPDLFSGLLKGMWDEDPLVSMRAADAAEKVSRRRPELLHPFKTELLSLLAEAQSQELRWHLAQMIPRLHLTTEEIGRAAASLKA